MADEGISEERVEALYRQLKEKNEKRGYYFNPDREFTKDLIRSLIVNEKRYGYQACPCRLAEEIKEQDQDIICPCDYRDADIEEYGSCFCGLYVSQEIFKGIKKARSIPERRPLLEERLKKMDEQKNTGNKKLPYPVWRCKVCGYLCARNEPPGVCPVCGVTKERFERFM
ncbi:MAG: ferredoxin-thioredoxin reductase catalytic domain-containing protein [Candidatus Altiarchaeia archaeon]